MHKKFNFYDISMIIDIDNYFSRFFPWLPPLKSQILNTHVEYEVEKNIAG